MPKALLIDDDPASQEWMSAALNAHGIVVVSAISPERALQFLKTESVDVILLDLIQQGRDGWSFCGQIRQWCISPILALSAFNDPVMISAALDAGADDYLVRPVSVNMLVLRVNALLRRAQMSSPSLLSPKKTGSLNFEQRAIHP